MTLTVRGTFGRGTFSREVSLQVEAGRPVGVVGPNGSGKSTLLHTVAGLDRMRAGSVELDGTVFDDADTFVQPGERRCVVMFQDLRLFPHMTVLGNVAYGPRCHGAPRREAEARAQEALASVGVAQLAGRQPATLSGGERQRVALARALVTNPRILLLDEPFAAVDAASRPALRDLLTRVLSGTGCHVMVVSHDPADIDGLCGGADVLGFPASD
ncbi:MAG: sulfate/molybdate ABC transporter ATP-binding protein [Acidimicrobiales bacterium]